MLPRRKVAGGLLAIIGYMLSPLSWWNDAFVNLPLALLFAWSISWFYRPAFEASFVAGYWLTNVLGFVLMHQGARKMTSEKRKYSRRDLVKDVAISLAYTGLIVLLIKLRIVGPIGQYIGGKHAAAAIHERDRGLPPTNFAWSPSRGKSP